MMGHSGIAKRIINRIQINHIDFTQRGNGVDLIAKSRHHRKWNGFFGQNADIQIGTRRRPARGPRPEKKNLSAGRHMALNDLGGFFKNDLNIHERSIALFRIKNCPTVRFEAETECLTPETLTRTNTLL